MAGPCSVESRDQVLYTAEAVKAAGATILRGGAFKPRTSPYAFQGSASQALRYLAEARDATGLPVITEVMESSQVDIVAEYADILQVGARNMQNYSLLRDVGRVARPVMLKRGFGATIEELLMAAEYIVSAGNPNVILCERGIRTFETYTRNTMDLSAIPVLRHLTHLPIIADPSHATGKRWLVKPLAIGGSRSAPTGSWSRSTRTRKRPCPTPSSSSTWTVPRHDGRHRPDPRAVGGLRFEAIAGPPARASGAAGWPAIERVLTADHATVRPAARLRGELRLPGDKSISHRALLLGDTGGGRSTITAAGDGADVRSTAGVMQALGASSSGSDPTAGRSTTPWTRRGRRARRADGILDCGNSGTSLRLIAGMPRRPADDVRPRRGCFIAPPSGRSYHRTAAPRWVRSCMVDANDSLPPLTVSGTPRSRRWTSRPRSRQPRSSRPSCSRPCEPTDARRSGNASRPGITPSGCCGPGRPGGSGGRARRRGRLDDRRRHARDRDRRTGAGDVSAAAFWLVAGAIHPTPS
jgi:3-deoxy-7-phosphoheptulonate synthase